MNRRSVRLASATIGCAAALVLAASAAAETIAYWPFGTNGFFSPQPARQWPGDADGDQRKRHRKNRDGHQTLPEHLSGSGEIAGTDSMGDLHGKALRQRNAKPTAQPGAGGHQPDRGRRSRAQTAHHRRIDKLKQDGSKLSENRRTAEQQREPHTLPKPQRRSAADVIQQNIFRR